MALQIKCIRSMRRTYKNATYDVTAGKVYKALSSSEKFEDFHVAVISNDSMEYQKWLCFPKTHFEELPDEHVSE